VGTGIFQVTYNVYALLLTVATAGIPMALSRLVSTASASGNPKLAKKYFSVALPAFMLIGLIAMLVMYLFADNFAMWMNNSLAAPGIRILAPAVFLVCIISVYRGYAQGFGNMIPTAASQVVEVVSKAVFGIVAALWLVRLGSGPDVISAGAILGVTVGLALCVPLLVWYKRKQDRGIPVLPDAGDLPGRMSVLKQIMMVSIPITLSASFMSIMVVIDNSIVLGRLQSALGYSEIGASALYGIFSRGMTIYNLPPALVVPVSVSIIPAIAAALARKRDSASCTDNAAGAGSVSNSDSISSADSTNSNNMDSADSNRSSDNKDSRNIDSAGSSEAGKIMQSSVKLVNLFAMPASAGMMVLASPIMIALYNDPLELTSQILVILGLASFFVCLQYVTTAILQANGHERVALMTFPVGAAAKILIGYFLTGNPDFGILASPIGTLVCFIIISTLNIVFIKVRVKDRPKFLQVFTKPLLCSVVMAGAAYAVYRLVSSLLSRALGMGRYAVASYLGVAILAGVAAYGLLIILTRTITAEDMKLIPRGEKLAKVLRIR